MKKIFLFLMVIFVFVPFCFADSWTTLQDSGGTEIGTAANPLICSVGTGTSSVSGNLGVGTTAPIHQLDVVGTSGIGIGTTLTGDALIIDAQGNVGLGSTKPVTRLSIVDTVNGGSNFLSLEKSVPSGAFGVGQILGKIAFGGEDNDSNFDFDGVVIQAKTNNVWNSTSHPTDLFFHTTPINSTTAAERMRIIADGNVGIGTMVPIRRLDVLGASGIGIGTTAAGDAMVVNANGNVGIGTINPLSKLTLVGIGTTSSTNALTVMNSLFTPTVRVLDDGNVGIGTTSPLASLHVGSAIGKIRLSSSASSYSEIYHDAINDDSLYILNQRNAAGANVYLGNAAHTQALTIINSGNVGIGTISPITKLSVVGGRISQDTWTNDGDVAVFYDTGGTNALGITASDIRLKKDLVDYKPSIDIINAVPTYMYHDYDQYKTDKLKLGMMAQDMMKVCPEATFPFKGKDGKEYYGIHYEKLTVILWNIVKEQDKRISKLEEQLKEVKK